MKEVTTVYRCDRCGAEVRPYGMPCQISSGYGVAVVVGGFFEPKTHLFNSIENADEFPPNAAGRKCAMALCGDCLDGLKAYLRNE